MLQRENINFEILAVSVDKDIEDAQYFIEDHPVDFILLSDTVGTVPALFNLKVMPTSFILDKNGTVIYKHEGFKVSDINIIAEKIRALSND
jgi:peroxiredoxin